MNRDQRPRFADPALRAALALSAVGALMWLGCYLLVAAVVGR